MDLALSYSHAWTAKEVGLHFTEAILVEVASEHIQGLDTDIDLIDALYGELTRAEALTELESQGLVMVEE